MGREFWPSEDEEKLAKLVAEGYSGSQCADRMSECGRRYTRSAILGKVFRMRLKMARKPSSTVGIARATGSRMPRRRKARGMVAPVEDTLPATVEQSEPVARAATPPDGGSRHHLPHNGYGAGEALLALQAGDCRWPIGEVGDRSFHFCRARAVEHKPYCQAHIRAAKSTSRGEPYGWLSRPR